MTSPVIQIKRGAFANLPALQIGEPALTTDTFELYVGIDSTTNGNKFFGSHRYWTRESTTTGTALNLLEGSDNGTNYVALKSPDSLSSNVTYTLPGTDGASGQVVSTDGSGVLSFIDAAANLSIAAGVGTDTVALLTDTLTFAGTANEIETEVTDNQVQFGLPDDVTITRNISIGGTVTVTGLVDGRDIADDGEAIDNLVTLTGVAKDDTNLGTFTGGTISDNVGIKTALQEIETQLEGGAAAITVSTGQTGTDASYYLTFVTNNNASGSAGQEPVFTDDGVSFNPVTNILTATNVSGTTSITSPDFYGNLTGEVNSVAFDTNPDGVVVTGVTTSSGGFVGDLTGEVNSVAFDTNADGVVVTGVTTSSGGFIGNLTGDVVTNSLQVGSVTVTNILDEDDLVSDSDAAIPTQQSVKAYVDAQLTSQDVDFAGDTGTGAVDLDSQSLTIAGTANEIETSASGQTLTVGLPDAVVVTTSIDVPTLEATNLRAKDGTTAITITDSTGAVAMANNLTIGGNLIVNGSTTQVNTTQTTIEDQLLELGMVDGAAPTSDLNVDIGLVLNYFDTSAKKAAIYWDDSSSRIVVSSDVTESSGVMTNNTSGSLELGSLYVSGCTGSTVEVIGCDSGVVHITNATIDAGTF